MTDFPVKVLKQVDRISDSIPQEEYDRRIDLRDFVIFTIDGEDAKDLDDAISVMKLGEGLYQLGVHIADVTHYVKEASPLDREALNRGTSVYLVDEVIPMLPRKLSNGLCSLNPNEDKLALTVFMDINRNGTVKNYTIKESIINSKHRLTYKEVSDYLENEEHSDNTYDIYEELEWAKELAEILMRKRDIRGALDFNTSECKIILDDNKHPIDIELYERRIANRIIEEFMIVTNETVSRYLTDLDIPCPYRVHEPPKEENFEEIEKILASFGQFYKMTKELNQKGFQRAINSLSDNSIAHGMILKTFRHAKYSSVPIGHFGLASRLYSHFTSPIRRYPDLILHRIVKKTLNGEVINYDNLKSTVDLACNISSEREIEAEELERETKKKYKALYMLDNIGEKFEGRICNILNFGFLVELDNTCLGVVRYDAMEGDYYYPDDDKRLVVGRETLKTYKLGDKITISVKEVNGDKIDFKLEG